MRELKLLMAVIGLMAMASAAPASSARVLKVLPHFLDLEGRHSLSPSLYERDAYQARLRQHPEQRGGLRFDVHCKSRGLTNFILRVEMRGAQGKEATAHTLEKVLATKDRFSGWSALSVTGEEYRRFGELVAWRVTLWAGSTLLAEQRSFLW